MSPSTTRPLPTSAEAARPAATSRAATIADSLTSRQWDDLVDVVLRRMELRVTEDLARRGRRSVPRVW